MDARKLTGLDVLVEEVATVDTTAVLHPARLCKTIIYIYNEREKYSIDTHGRPRQKMDFDVGIDALDIVENGENLRGSSVDVEAIQRGILPGIIVSVRL